MENPKFLTDMVNVDNDNLYLDGLFSQQSDVLPSSVAAITLVQGTKGNGGQKKINKEDELIVSNWLNTREDPVNGTVPIRENFCKRFAEYYNTNKDLVPDHTDNNSMMHR